MFYLTTHSTHFIYGYMASDHSYSEKGNPLPPHRLLFPINSKGSFICTIPQTGYPIPQPLLHQSWSTGWNEKYLNGSTPWRIDPTTHRTMSERSYHGATSCSSLCFLMFLMVVCFRSIFELWPCACLTTTWCCFCPSSTPCPSRPSRLNRDAVSFLAWTHPCIKVKILNCHGWQPFQKYIFRSDLMWKYIINIFFNNLF